MWLVLRQQQIVCIHNNMDFNRYSYPVKRPYANLKPKKTIHGDSWKKTLLMNQKFNADTVMARLDTLLFRGSSGLAYGLFTGYEYLLKSILSCIHTICCWCRTSYIGLLHTSKMFVFL